MGAEGDIIKEVQHTGGRPTLTSAPILRLVAWKQRTPKTLESVEKLGLGADFICRDYPLLCYWHCREEHRR
jgi:hypothetical protein